MWRSSVWLAVMAVAGAPAWAADLPEAESAAAVEASEGTPSGESGRTDGTAEAAGRPVQGLASEADAMALCEMFMQGIVAGRYEEAFQLIRPYFPVAESRVAKIESETRQQLGMAELQFGRAVNHTFIGAEVVQDSFLRYRFLQRFDRDAIIWEFVFYRPGDAWYINALGFDDEVRSLFE